jgi:hypothetical protein
MAEACGRDVKPVAILKLARGLRQASRMNTGAVRQA